MIVALAGTQGSGKSSIAKRLLNDFSDSDLINIKMSFSRYADPIWEEISKVRGLTKEGNLLAYKQLQRSISTWGEQFVDPKIWSDTYKGLVSRSRSKLIVTDDIRTTMNCDALINLAQRRQVLVFQLLVDEEIARERISTWRENDYLEKPLAPMESFGSFIWHVIDASVSLDLVYKQVKERVVANLNHV